MIIFVVLVILRAKIIKLYVQKEILFADAVVQARQTIADCLKVSPEEIIFTSGATEANNLAIKGIAFANRSKGQHIITTEVEHSSVYNTCKQLETHFGFKVTYLKPNSKGEISFTQLYDAIRPDTILISVMRANNETGKIYNIPCFTELAFIQDIPFHTDATQSFAFLHDYPKVMGVNAFSFTSHKINGPKGVGALYLKHDTPCLPIITGGHQEHGMRGGTTSVPLIVGFAEAVKAAKDYVTTAIKHSLAIGKGCGPTHHFVDLYRKAGMLE